MTATTRKAVTLAPLAGAVSRWRRRVTPGGPVHTLTQNVLARPGRAVEPPDALETHPTRRSNLEPRSRSG